MLKNTANQLSINSKHFHTTVDKRINKEKILRIFVSDEIHVTTLITVFHSLLTIFAEIYVFTRGRRGRDHMVVGFTSTYAIGAYYCSGEVYSIQHNVIKFISNLR